MISAEREREREMEKQGDDGAERRNEAVSDSGGERLIRRTIGKDRCAERQTHGARERQKGVENEKLHFISMGRFYTHKPLCFARSAQRVQSGPIVTNYIIIPIQVKMYLK